MDGEPNGEQWDIDSDINSGSAGDGGTEPAATAPAPARRSTAVDLAAWGRGEWEYPFSEIVRAIDDYVFDQVWKLIEQRGVSIKTRGDALQFIIGEGLISSAEARGDV